MKLNPINQVEGMLGVKVVHHRITHMRSASCGAPGSADLCSDLYRVTCVECLKILKKEILKFLSGNPISASYNAHLEYVNEKLGEYHEQ